MISIFLSKRGTSYSQMLSQNGDIILEHCISATVKMDRNAIWYLTVEVPESELLGYTITDESVFKVDLNFIKGQLFRMIYPKYNRTKRTYTFYASHIFFDAQYECMWDSEPDWTIMEGASEASPVSWTEAINKITQLMNMYRSGGINLPYNIYGDPPSNQFLTKIPEENREFYICPAQNTGYAIDVTNASITENSLVKLYRTNRTKAQKYYIVSRGSGYYNLIYRFGNRCVGRPVSTESVIKITKNPTSDQAYDKWNFTWVESQKGFRINSNLNNNYVISNQNGTLANQNPIVLMPYGTYSAGAQTWRFSYCDFYQNLKWDGKNIVECLFGTDDNSMANAYPQVAEKHTTAMFNNYDCYFGDMEQYPDELKPRTIYLTDKEVTEYSEKRTVENVITGIIPEGASGEVYNDSQDQSKRIVTGPSWNEYEIKRISKMTYDDISYSADDTGDSDAFTDKGAYNSALKNAALVDMRKKKYKEPDIETTAKIVDLFEDSNPTVGNAKLNDTLMYISDDGSIRRKFYFESLTLDLIMNRITGASLVEESEVE